MNEYLISQLKQGRLNKGFKQSDVSKMTGIKNTTLSNYENGVTEPDIDTFLSLCELYELDFVSIIEEAYGIQVPGKNFHIRNSEIELLKKYRALDEHGKKMVDFVLAEESDRCSASIDHFRGNFMDGVQTWPADKVPSNRIAIPNDAAWLSAAHNDHASDPEEQEKMQTDMKLLKRPEK